MSSTSLDPSLTDYLFSPVKSKLLWVLIFMARKPRIIVAPVSARTLFTAVIRKKVGPFQCGMRLPSPKRLPAAQGFGRRGFAQAGISECGN